MRYSRSLELLIPCLGLVALLGCGGGSGSSSPKPAGSIEITSVPAYNSQEGTSGGLDAWVQVERHGYDGPITLSLSGFPARGTTGFVSTIPAGQTSGLCRVGIDGCVVAGTYPITAYASGDGIPTVSGASIFTQQAGASNVYIHPAANSMSLDPGSSISLRILVSRLGGIADTLSFTASGLPTGVTAQFSKTPDSTDDMILTLNAASGAAPGSYTLDWQVSASSWSSPKSYPSLPFIVTGATPSQRIELAGGPFTVAQGNHLDIPVRIKHFGGDTSSASVDVATPFFGMPLPIGLNISFPSGSSFDQDGVLRVTADKHMTPGVYYLEIFEDASTETAFELTVAPG